MKFKLTQKFNFPLKNLLIARNERYKHLDKFPELNNIQLLEEKEVDGFLFQKRKIIISGSIPKPLSNFISELSLIDESKFDIKNNIHSFKLSPPDQSELVTISGSSEYISINEQETERHYDVEVRSKIFLLGPIIEGIVTEMHKNSLEKDRNSMNRFLTEEYQ